MSVMQKAAVYVRQSVNHKEGIDRALARCIGLVEARGWTLAGTYADNNVSASKSRAGTRWADLLEDIAAGRVDVVVGVDMDRLVRSIQDLGKLIELGVRVLTVDGEIDLTTADGEFRATMLAGIARFETRRKGERQLRGNEGRISRGYPSAGKRRFGFLTKNIKPHPVEAPQVVHLFEQVKSGVPLYALAKKMGRDTVTIRGMLTNKAYAGFVPVGVYETRDDGRKKLVRRDWVAAAPEVARIVSDELFEEVQAILNDPVRKISPGGQVAFLASGLARCGVCSGPLHSRSGNYLCTADLTHPCISKKMLDDVLKWEVFTYLASNPGAEGGDVLELSRELEELNDRRTRAQELALWDGADLGALRKEVGALGREIERVTGELSAARSERVAADVVSRIREALANADLTDEDGAAWWEAEWAGLSFTEQRELVRCLTVVVHKGRGPERVHVTS